MSNTQTVEQMYEAFGRRDIPAILAKLSDKIEWEYGMIPNDVPWLQKRQGKKEVASFFESLNALDFQKFVPKAIMENNGKVVSLVDFDATVKKTGKRIVEEG